jgi:hypothetical protein
MRQQKPQFKRKTILFKMLPFFFLMIFLFHLSYAEELEETDTEPSPNEEIALEEKAVLENKQEIHAETNASMKFSPYGFVKASYLGSTRALDSFGNPNLSAPTTAHPNTGIVSNRYQSSFQAQQSRFGLWIEADSKIKTQTEIDFFHPTTASPTTGAYPRLRIAKIVYQPNETYELILGQDWDIINQLNPFTYNIIGQNFHAGDAGFLRQQFKFKAHVNEKINLNFSIGMAMKNDGINNSIPEESNLPSFAFALKYIQNEKFYWGVSAIGTKIRIFSNNNIAPYQSAYGFFLYDNLKLGSFIEILSQVFYGQNLANIGTLSLGQGSSTSNIQEWGGFVSANFALKKNISIFGGFGLDQISNSIGSSIYDDFSPFLNITGNKKATLGVKQDVSKALTFYAEANQFWTSFISTSPTSYGNKSNTHATLLELGAIMNF